MSLRAGQMETGTSNPPMFLSAPSRCTHWLISVVKNRIRSSNYRAYLVHNQNRNWNQNWNGLEWELAWPYPPKYLARNQNQNPYLIWLENWILREEWRLDFGGIGSFSFSSRIEIEIELPSTKWWMGVIHFHSDSRLQILQPNTPIMCWDRIKFSVWTFMFDNKQ